MKILSIYNPFFCLFLRLFQIYSISFLIIEFYYEYYKSNLLFKGKLKTIFVALQIIFNIIFLAFSFIMLRDQWGIIQNDSTMIDMKKKRFEEKREISEVMNETFGCGFVFSLMGFFSENSAQLKTGFLLYFFGCILLLIKDFIDIFKFGISFLVFIQFIIALLLSFVILKQIQHI